MAERFSPHTLLRRLFGNHAVIASHLKGVSPEVNIQTLRLIVRSMLSPSPCLFFFN